MADSTVRPYKPPSHLVARSFLTAAQLSSEFESFQESLAYLPELVFERLVGNLNECFYSYIELERRQHAAALQRFENENEVLQSLISKLQTKFEILQASIPTTKDTPVYQDSSLETPPNLETPQSRIPGTGAAVRFTFEAGQLEVDTKAHVTEALLDMREIYRNGCTWLDITSTDRDPNFQDGIYTTLDIHPHGLLPPNNVYPITFPHAYAAPPTVVVWLTGFNAPLHKQWRVKTSASDVTQTGFTLHINTWGGSELFSAGVSWVSYQADDPQVHSCRLNTWVAASWKGSKLRQEKWQDCGPDIWGERTRRHLLLVDSIDVDNARELSLALQFQDTATPGSFKWKMTARPADAKLYSVGVTYVGLT